MSSVRIGVAVTSFNRREKTIACLQALFSAAAQLEESVIMSVVLTDDASSDGTPELVEKLFPQVEILRGNGDLFWAGGMRLALERLYARRLDYYLWLNDDTVLYGNALKTLLITHRTIESQCGAAGIVVGSTQDLNGNITYGGMLRKRRRLGALTFDYVLPGDKPLRCDASNGNVVLVAAGASSALGNLDGRYRHGMADIDYGLRATCARIPVWVMPGYAGVCARDHGRSGSFLDSTLPFKRRWELLVSPKGLPYRSWLTLCKRHSGSLWTVHFVWPYARTILSSATTSLFGLRTRRR